MNSWVNNTVLIIQTFTFVRSTGLTAVHSSQYVYNLYQELGNEANPSETELAVSNAQVRKLICENIIGSKFFLTFNLIPYDVERMRDYQDDPLYSEIFNQLFDCTASKPDCEYMNRYEPREFCDERRSWYFREHVFICLSEYIPDRSILPLYVSKEYDLGVNKGPGPGPYMPGRFVFGNLYPDFLYLDFNDDPILAEEPGIALTLPTFNVEHHYFQIRKYANRAESNGIDPLCRLVSHRVIDGNNPHTRLCVAVFSSAYFKDKVVYPRSRTYACSSKEVSFKTAEGAEEAAGESYLERMTRCSTNFLGDQEENALYISRAYRSNQVFVYARNTSDRKIYLKTLIYNINISDELNSFDFIEY